MLLYYSKGNHSSSYESKSLQSLLDSFCPGNLETLHSLPRGSQFLKKTLEQKLFTCQSDVWLIRSKIVTFLEIFMGSGVTAQFMPKLTFWNVTRIFIQTIMRHASDTIMHHHFLLLFLSFLQFNHFMWQVKAWPVVILTSCVNWVCRSAG